MENCSICLEELSDSSTVVMKSSCGHWTFHKNCLHQWFEKSGTKMCPLCKQSCPREENKELSARMARTIHGKYWKDWGRLRMCCSRDLLLSSGLTATLTRNGHLYKRLIDNSAREKTSIICRLYRQKKEFICQLKVFKGQTGLQYKFVKLICKENK